MQEPAGAAPERGPNGAFPAAALAEHARRAFAAADVRASRLGAGALAMEGMSGAATRHLYNNLASLPGCRCLQIGAWKGSSVIAALSNNGSCHVTAVDDWSEFGGPRGEFLEACERLLTEDGRARLQVGRLVALRRGSEPQSGGPCLPCASQHRLAACAREHTRA